MKRVDKRSVVILFLLSMILLFAILPMVSAYCYIETPDLQTCRQNANCTISFTVTNETDKFLGDTSVIVINALGEQVYSGDISSTAGFFSVLLNTSQTSGNGYHQIYLMPQDECATNTEIGLFLITPKGNNLDLGSILVYMLFLILCPMMIYISGKLTGTYKESEEHENLTRMYQLQKEHKFSFYLELLKKKLWIVGVFGIYLFLFIFISLSAQLSYELNLTDLQTILTNLVIIIGWGFIPFIIFWMGYIIIYFYKSITAIMKYQFGNDTWRNKR